jgi:hypothetical protein
MFDGVPELSTAIDTKQKASADKTAELESANKRVLRECKTPDT